MANRKNCVVDGANLVWKHILESCSSRELSSHLRPHFDDMLCGIVEYSIADECVLALDIAFLTDVNFLVLISILSNTFTRINEVCTLLISVTIISE